MSKERDIVVEMIEKREKQLEIIDRAVKQYNNNPGLLQGFEGIALFENTIDEGLRSWRHS